MGPGKGLALRSGWQVRTADRGGHASRETRDWNGKSETAKSVPKAEKSNPEQASRLQLVPGEAECVVAENPDDRREMTEEMPYARTI